MEVWPQLTVLGIALVLFHRQGEGNRRRLPGKALRHFPFIKYGQGTECTKYAQHLYRYTYIYIYTVVFLMIHYIDDSANNYLMSLALQH